MADLGEPDSLALQPDQNPPAAEPKQIKVGLTTRVLDRVKKGPLELPSRIGRRLYDSAAELLGELGK